MGKTLVPTIPLPAQTNCVYAPAVRYTAVRDIAVMDTDKLCPEAPHYEAQFPAR